MQPDPVQNHLVNLLSYADEVLKGYEKPLMDLGKDAHLAIYAHDVVGLEGVSTDAGDGVWLEVARLREVAAPTPPDEYLPWVAPRKNQGPFEMPRLAETLIVRSTLEEASDLLEAGLALPDDVMAPLGEKAIAGNTIDVLLRLPNLTDFVAGFDAWLKGPWAEWTATEKPRRHTMGIYNRLFEFQQRAASMGDDVPVEVVFGSGLARWSHPLGKINIPLIHASVELELNPEGSIVVRAREKAPTLYLRPFDVLEIEGVGLLMREASTQLERFYNDSDVGFSPHNKSTYETVLRMCHARLAADAVYEADAREDSIERTPLLRISETWVLFVRTRSTNFRSDDIQRLISTVQATDSANLPGPAVQLTTRPSNERDNGAEVNLRGSMLGYMEGATPSSASYSDGQEKAAQSFFFPLPYNDDQVEIVRRLEDDMVTGVVVQGPPGTGKTHTIANIIAHYLATGRRVLVSAHEAEALSAIQQKLPETIRDLAIAIIHSDRDGTRQLEQAVDILASQVKSIDKRAYSEECIGCERDLAKTRADLAELDERIRSYADLNMRKVAYGDAEFLPMDLAATLEMERPLHTWFPDRLDLTECHDARFDTAAIEDARRIRSQIGHDIGYSASHLPDLSRLPDIGRLLAAHAALIRDRKADDRSSGGDLPFLSLTSGGMSEATALKAWLDDLASLHEEGQKQPWLLVLYGIHVGTASVHQAVKNGLTALCSEWSALAEEGRAFALSGVTIPGVPPQDAAFDTAVAALAADKKPFGLFAFGKSALKSQIESVRVHGVHPDNAAAWTTIHDYRSWQRRALDFAGRWSSAARACDLHPLEGDWPAMSGDLLRLGDFVARIITFAAQAPGQVELVRSMFPYGVDARKVVYAIQCDPVRESLAAAIGKEGNIEARQILQNLQALAVGETPFSAAVAGIVAALRDEQVKPQDLAAGWREILDEAKRLDGLRAGRERLEAVASLVHSSGAPQWASALLTEVADDDRLTPGHWERSWTWARADGHVRNLAGRETLSMLSARRLALEEKQRELLARIVRLRTFIGLKQSITDRVASALTKFAMKVRQLGAGTGKSATRQRRAIREAALEAAEAVPCWILPEWRVAEQLPSELAAFDLVIIDEASQSDITSLPTVLRGKKVLIVGDDKQVSPLAVGMEERFVIQLRETFLKGMDIANYLEPTTSLYDLTSITFPGTVILLREHFRCVEPIINFSSRFYPKALIPLRVASAEERLDPPLIDIYVPLGRKVRDVNEAEAQVIVDEITRIVEDPAYAKRTIGMISLIGDKQAKRVSDLLMASVGPEAIARHRIRCGNASTFQGQERDIIFLSMVACPETKRAQTAKLMEQRFNVALSRARDRMYLVRSVAASMLNVGDLKLAVIEHFSNPMKTAIVPQPKDILDLCGSGFEVEVGRRLLDLGYRVRPQVQVGGYFIDFVIEGDGNRRLAVELDGDRYHPPSQWAADQHRQRAMERLGWMFWRCWGSHWITDRQGCLDDLIGTLDRMGIRPVGGDYASQVYTEHRVIGGSTDLGEAAQVAAAESGHPVLATSNSGLNVAVPSAAVATQKEPEHDERTVAAGDIVIVRFADDNKILRLRLSREENNVAQGIVHIGQPIAEALLGGAIEEEVDLVVGGLTRRVIIEKITKAA
jgi:very-short-patch-repair endonuclease/transcription elongation GreA/GreB family factor